MKEKTRTSLKVTLLFLSLLLAFVYTSSALAQAPGAFTPTGNMTTPRGGHSATLLLNGKVLITGGESASAELYDPSTGTFAATGNMITARKFHTATLLYDGRVLIIGGFLNNGKPFLASAELYDPSTGIFTATGSMLTARGWHTATLLYDGRVLVAGADHTPELYDPATGTFAVTGAFAGTYAAPFVETATLLPDGKVLMTGGDSAVAAPLTELYDPGTGTFGLITGGVISGPGALGAWWVNVNTATLLMNGKVLIVGSDEYAEPADAALYDPSTGTITGIGNTAASHEFSTATLLPGGTVLIAGGQLPGGSGAVGTDLYDPATGKFSATKNMITGRHSHTATLLPDGTVLIAGGYSVWPAPTSIAELYFPRLLTPALVVTDLRFDVVAVSAGASYSVNVAGSNLTSQTFFDVRFKAPGSNAYNVILNWQKGFAASHDVPAGTAAGSWTIDGGRAHEIEADHTGSFFPVSATITVSP